jgi:hypothetical protein
MRRRRSGRSIRDVVHLDESEGTVKNIFKLMGALFVLDVCLFAISGIPTFRDAKHGWKDVIGGIGWFGGCLLALGLIVLAVATLVRSAMQRRSLA